MIGSEALPAGDRIGAIDDCRALTEGRSAETAPALIYRLLLAILLAAVAVLIPGEATRLLETPPLGWSEVFHPPPTRLL